MAINPRTIKVAGGVLIAASAAVFGVLKTWEPTPGNPGLVYADQLAGGLPTVCNGITKHVTRTPVIVGEVWSAEKCYTEEVEAITKVQLTLAPCFKRTPPQSVFDMATSHAWNLGAGATCGSKAMEAWNKGDWALGCRRLGLADSGEYVWSYVSTGKLLPNGKPEKKFIRGLANRRADETKRCIEGLPQ